VRWDVREFTDLGDVIVADGKVAGVGRGSNVPFEADETNVFWFRDGALVRLQGFPTRETALRAVEEIA
jgi:hypothetical protein